jgi:hypothetical protein
MIRQHTLCKWRIESYIARLVRHVVFRKEREDKTESQAKTSLGNTFRV